MLWVLGAFVLEGGVRGIVVLAALITFYLAIVHRLSGEDTRNAERGGMFLGG